MESALRIVRAVSELDPNLKIVALAVADSDPEIMTWAEAGIAGFVTRDNSLNDLVAAVIASERGELSCSPRHAAALLHHVATMATRTTAPQRASPPQLTRRQSHVLELVGSGLSNKEIARTLGIEVATVKNHVHQVLEKLEVTRRSDAATIAHQLAVHSNRTVPHEAAATSAPSI